MYRVLIVDDEILECDYLLNLIDWDSFRVETVRTAHSVRQAIGIMSGNPMDLVLCDIEMPRQDGMELLRWARRRKLASEFIFITCHTDFSYAQQALHLNSMDYLLKPVSKESLREALERVFAEIKKDRGAQLTSEQSREQFMLDIAQGALRRNPAAAREQLTRLGFQAEPFLPLLFHTDWSGLTLFSGASYYRRYIAKNIVSDVVFGFDPDIILCSWTEECCLALVPQSHLTARETELEEGLCLLSRKSKEALHVTVHTLIGDPCPPGQMAEALDALLDWTEHYRFTHNPVLHLSQVLGDGRAVHFQPEPWTALLMEGHCKEACLSFDGYIEELQTAPYLSTGSLTGAFSDVMQTVYSVLKKKNIPASRFLRDDQWRELYATSVKSIDHFQRSVHMLLASFTQANDFQSITVSQQIINYVQCNIGTNITREEIARHISLSPEYVSKLFKKETGMALFDFIIQKKIEVAKEFLADTNISINRIASNLGYSNFSHFSKQFREVTGMTPGTYRQSLPDRSVCETRSAC